MDTIHIVAVGSGTIESLNAEVQQLLASARHLVLPAAGHPVAGQLRDRGIRFSELPQRAADDNGPGAREIADELELESRRIADGLRCLAVEYGAVVYISPTPRPLLDPAVVMLCDDPDLTVVIHPGPSETAEHRRSEPHTSFDQLVAIMRRLRGPDGCAWDREQTHASLARHLIEEAYEAVDTIERQDNEGLVDELGDVLLQVVFHAQIASDEGRFDIADVLAGILAKLVRRHPHIFAEAEAATSSDVAVNWERIKRREKNLDGSALQGVLPSLPALMYAEKLQSKAARVGFDWDEYRQVIAKVKEELAEVAEAKEGEGDVEAEIGDVLFAVVNLARFLDVDCETALRGVCARFIGRFETMERLAAERGVVFADLPLDDKEKLWQQAKAESPD